jgi:hypothetical protein
MKIFVIAHLPDQLQKAFTQHVRDFDVANPGCHFEIALDGPNMTVIEMVDAIRLNPALSFAAIFEREKK